MTSFAVSWLAEQPAIKVMAERIGLSALEFAEQYGVPPAPVVRPAAAAVRDVEARRALFAAKREAQTLSMRVASLERRLVQTQQDLRAQESHS